jgi:hypothetical protein
METYNCSSLSQIGQDFFKKISLLGLKISCQGRIRHKLPDARLQEFCNVKFALTGSGVSTTRFQHSITSTRRYRYGTVANLAATFGHVQDSKSFEMLSLH